MSENESLYEYMYELGFLVVLKPTVDVVTHESAKPESEQKGGHPEKTEEKTIVKGNVDAELVLYAMKELPNYDKAVIVSGDGDFFGLIEYLEELGRLEKVLTPNWQYSSLLKPFEHKIIRLDQLRRQLAYKDRRPRKKSPNS